MLEGKYEPVHLKNLKVENKVGLFDYLATHFENPYSNQIINLRPISYMSEKQIIFLRNIFDKRDFTEYWNCYGSVSEYKNLDVDLNYHFFIPTHVHFQHYVTRYAKDIEVKCGINTDDMETILRIPNNNVPEKTVEVQKKKMCRFFRYQMNGKNSEGHYNIDLHNFDLYGDLYASTGLIQCTSKTRLKMKGIVFFLMMIT